MRNSKRTVPTDFGTTPVEAVDGEVPLAGMVEPDARRGAVATRGQAALTRGSRSAEVEDALSVPPAWPIWLGAGAVSVLWALAPLAFAIGYRNGVAPLTQDGFGLAVFILLAMGPAVLVWVAAYALREAQKLGAETRRAQAMAHDMLAPSLAAAARAGDVAKGVREEIARASDAADEARETLLALRQALADDAARLTEATQASVRTAGELTGSLGRERAEMSKLAESLDAQAVRVADTIGQQGRMVAEAAGLADAQLREAEGMLSARAADLAAAAGEAGTAARTAGEDLVRHIARLETAGVGVADQVRAVEGGLGEQRAALITLAHALRADHEGFAAEADAHAGRLEEFISQARLSAAEMSERATRGGESLRQMMAEAAEQFRDLAETARAEREEFGQSTVQSLEAVSQAAADQRAQLEAQTRAAIEALASAADQTRDAAARHAITAREQVEQLSEAAFAAGQKANQVFEARLEEARALVEQSSQMVEQAGAATARKLDEGATAARRTLEELRTMLGEVEERARSLPAAARGQADEVRAVVAEGMDQLMANARRTADEAHAIDAAFQERVRRNFEMLSQAVRLMGLSVNEAPAAAPPAPVAAPVPAVAKGKRFSASYSSSLRATQPPPQPEPPVNEEEEEELELSQPASGAEIADEIGLRPRLKLTPTENDAAISQIFEGEDEPEAEHEGEAWTWKDLLASIDGGVGEDLESLLAAELADMNVDPGKLLPKSRTGEIAAVVQTGDLDGARQVVRRLAPAAVRRIVRRLGADEALHGRAGTFVRRYQALVDDAAVKDPEGLLMAGMLDSEAGRLYLLLDAATGDML